MKVIHYRPRKALIERIARARAAGETVYRSDTPCQYGHDTLRFVANGNCRECGERYRATYRERRQAVEVTGSPQ